jgi:hypothetical protein
MDLFASVSAAVLSVFIKRLISSFLIKCLSDLKNLHQTKIPMYSFTEHQRLDENKYLYGATIIIGIVWSLKKINPATKPLQRRVS